MSDPTEQTSAVKDDPIAGVRKAVIMLAIAGVLLALAVFLLMVGRVNVGAKTLGAVLPMAGGALAFGALLHSWRKNGE